MGQPEGLVLATQSSSAGLPERESEWMRRCTGGAGTHHPPARPRHSLPPCGVDFIILSWVQNSNVQRRASQLLFSMSTASTSPSSPRTIAPPWASGWVWPLAWRADRPVELVSSCPNRIALLKKNSFIALATLAITVCFLAVCPPSLPSDELCRTGSLSILSLVPRLLNIYSPSHNEHATIYI